MADQASRDGQDGTNLVVNPGACGFSCTIYAIKTEKNKVEVTVMDSDCDQIQKLSELLKEISMEELFTPVVRNPMFLWAEKARCHTTCLIPFAILKAVEVEMDMGVSKNSGIEFE